VTTKSQDRRKVRLSRALGIPLTPKAARYLEKRPYAPGEHGRTKRKADSDYAVRLREKQRLREQYGIREKQMRNTFNEARRHDGLTGLETVFSGISSFTPHLAGAPACAPRQDADDTSVSRESRDHVIGRTAS
jgi:hypothetical protein